MSYDPENKVAMSLKDFGDKLIYEFIEPLIESNPYLSFMVLSASIEFIGKCRNKKRILMPIKVGTICLCLQLII